MIDKKVREAITDTLQFVYNSGYERAKRKLPIDTKQSIFVERETKILIDSIAEATTYKQVKDLSGFPKKKEKYKHYLLYAFNGDKYPDKDERDYQRGQWNTYTNYAYEEKIFNKALEEIGNLPIRLKPLDVGEVEKVIISFFTPVLPVPFSIGDLAQAIVNFLTLPKEELDEDKAIEVVKNMEWDGNPNKLKINVVKALCQAYKQGLLKKE